MFTSKTQRMTVLLAALFLFIPSVSAADGRAVEMKRGLFVSVIQEPPVLSNRRDIQNLVEFAKKERVHTLFVQIYRENKAWFPSKIGDASPYKACLKTLGEDPLALLLKEAHGAGLEVHAWLNLLSLGANERSPLLRKHGREILTRNRHLKWTLASYKIDDQYFLEPGDPRVQKDLETMLVEVLTAYPELDGVQFDYIRYPDLHPFYGHSSANVERYIEATGIKDAVDDSSEWKDWKRLQVTSLLERLAGRARSMRPGIQVSTTGLVPYSRADLEGFQDWRAWLDRGLVDFVTLMCYTPSADGFLGYLRDARRTGDMKKMNIAVGAYRLAARPETFRMQWQACEESEARACIVFHYGDLVTDPGLTSALTSEKKLT